jgi:hypothetical protein
VNVCAIHVHHMHISRYHATTDVTTRPQTSQGIDRHHAQTKGCRTTQQTGANELMHLAVRAVNSSSSGVASASTSAAEWLHGFVAAGTQLDAPLSVMPAARTSQRES